MSNQQEVEVSYDVGNEFFRLWLDEKMNYTCGNWDGVDTLEAAQVAKLEWHARAANVGPGKRLLDIGCGWGANLEYQTRVKGCTDAVGITLSRSQCEEVNRRNLPGVAAKVCDYRDFRPDFKFDSVISICMMEHIATPEEVREGKHIGLYRDFFRRIHGWTNPGASFGLQTILRNRVPRIKEDLEDIGFVTYKIFPGGLSLRLEDIIKAVNPYWEITEVYTRREDYEKTCAEWLARLRKHEGTIRAQWGDVVFDDYDRYLRTCVRGFHMHYQSLAQYVLRRID
ncbi:MAG: class I SAM-dependent methyltransferase [Myxococcales bacterium]|nr:class I SAM-dependent methyltransferase [Myxococcales bacterium]MCB9530925.1 class I SAM-dependent methyltransferase [Myxococcales bacterium]MCB9534527.1 class I SAM-dependent methyltransferase [Myxococcales bacterium]